MNQTGVVIVEPQFEEAKPFKGKGLAKVKLGGKWGFIDTKGNWIVQPKYRFALDFTNNGLAAVGSADGSPMTHGYINSAGEIVLVLDGQ